MVLAGQAEQRYGSCKAEPPPPEVLSAPHVPAVARVSTIASDMSKQLGGKANGDSVAFDALSTCQ